jgi:heme-degrading monooxygenase HmoA
MVDTSSQEVNPFYYAVIFTSELIENNALGYSEMAASMLELAKKQPGFLEFESARSDIGISVSYWRDLESIRKWKQISEHLHAQRLGKENWYASYKIRIARVEKEYSFKKLSI